MKWMIPVVCLLVSASAAFAENPLTLDECLAEAGENNPDLAASRSAVQKAKYDYKASYGDMLPQVSANAGSSRSRAESGADNLATTRDSASYGLSASQSLYTGGRNRAAVDQGSANLQAVTADLGARRATLSYDVRNAFAQLLFAQEQIELTRTILKRRQDNLDLIQLRYEGGRENKGALLLTQASARDAEYGVAQAERFLRVAQRQLARVLGRDESDLIQVSGKLEAGRPMSDADFETLAADTPTHRRAVAQLRAARAGLDSAKSQYFPELAANASAGRSGEDWMPEQDEWFLGVSLSFPFFQGGKNVMNVRGAGAELQRVEANLRATDADLVLVLQQTLADYADAVDRTEVQSAYLNAQEVRAEIGRSQYASGMLSFEDWDRIENDLIGSQKDDLAGRRDAVLAEANWDKVQGKSRLPE